MDFAKQNNDTFSFQEKLGYLKIITYLDVNERASEPKWRCQKLPHPRNLEHLGSNGLLGHKTTPKGKALSELFKSP